MRLSALEIKKQDFKKVMRGYEPNEVRAFMELVASHYEELVSDNRELSHKITELETSLKDYRQVEKVLHQTMLQAEETSKQMSENAKNQANNILKEAEVKGMAMIEAAKQDVSELRQQIGMLQNQRQEMVNRLKVLLDVMNKNLKDFETDYRTPHSFENAEKEAVQKIQVTEVPVKEIPKPNKPDSVFQPVQPVQKQPNISTVQPKTSLDDILSKLD